MTFITSPVRVRFSGKISDCLKMFKMRSIRSQKMLLFIFAFSAGVFLTLLVTVQRQDPQTSSYRSAHPSSDEDFGWRRSEYLLVVVIPSAPSNVRQRNAIRQTWINGKDQLADRRYPRNFPPPQLNDEGFLIHETIEEQIRQLKLFSEWHENLRADTFDSLPVKIKHLFVMGSNNLDAVDARALIEEDEQHEDLLILPQLVDSYVNLTRKMLMAFVELQKEIDFDYLMKVDDDTYVNLSILAEDLWRYHSNLRATQQDDRLTPQLYWGFFNGRAQIKTGGQWKESNYNNICDKFLPYALGGGYVLSRGLIQYIAGNAHRLISYRSEDVSVGTWLITQKHVHRRHDVRFDTGYMPRRCQPYHLVLHKRTVEDMYKLWNGVSCSQLQSSVQYHAKPKEYYYDWSQPPTKCCDAVLN